MLQLLTAHWVLLLASWLSSHWCVCDSCGAACLLTVVLCRKEAALKQREVSSRH